MIISQILHSKCSPNSLGVVIVALTNYQQVESAVECFDWGKAVLFELLQIVQVLMGINFLNEFQSELFIRMTDSEIIENWVDF